MATQSNRFKKSDTRSREKHTRLLKSKLEANEEENVPEKGDQPDNKTIMRNDKDSDLKKEKRLLVKKTRGGLLVEQVLEYSDGMKRPILDVTIRLTTANRGKRKENGLVESAYLLRLEVIKAAPNVKVEGFQLGPWNGDGLNLDQGGLIVCDPLWTGFQPKSTEIKGRLLLKDTSRKRLVDLPWKTEAVIPGADPYAG